MGFLDKIRNRKGPEGGDGEQGAGAGGRRAGRRGAHGRPDDMTSSIKETVFDTLLQDMRDNKAFRLGDRYLVMLLDCERAGLTPSQAKDQDKSQLLQLIDSGTIRVHANEDMLKRNEVAIVPTAGTIQNLSEFMIMTTQPFEAVTMDDEERMEDLGFKMTVDEALEIVTGKQDVQVFVDAKRAQSSLAQAQDDAGEAALTQPMASLAAEPAAEPAASPAAEPAEAEADAEGAGMTRDLSAAAAAASEPDAGETGASEPDDGGQGGSGPDGDAGDSDEGDGGAWDDEGDSEGDEGTWDDEGAPAPEESVLVSEERYQRAVARVFAADDLDIVVTTESFDLAFPMREPPLFDERAGDGWLDKQLAAMAREANSELRRARLANRERLLRFYTKLVDISCNELRASFSLDGDTDYARLIAEAKERRESRAAELRREADDKEAELDRAFEQAIERVGELARERAEADERARLEHAHAAEVREARAAILAGAEVDFERERREILEHRRADASGSYDYNLEEILRRCRELDATFAEDEAAEYERLAAEMRLFRDEHRKEELALAETQAKELEQSRRVERTIQESEARISEIRADYEAKRAATEEEARAAVARSQGELNEYRKIYNARNKALREESMRKDDRIDELTKAITQIDERAEASYAKRLAAAADELEASNLRYQQLATSMRRNFTLVVAIAVAAAIAAGAIGVVIGTNASLSAATDDAAARIERSVSESLERMEEAGTSARTEVAGSAKASKQ